MIVKKCIYLWCWWGEIHWRKKAFCFKSQPINSPKFYQRTKTVNAHSVYIPLMCILRIGYVYIPRRGNIVSSLFISLGRLAMPKICGRKATSLTSFLFLYHLLSAIVRRLEWQKKHNYGRKGTFGLWFIKRSCRKMQNWMMV